MSFSHPLLTLSVAGLLWIAGDQLAARRDAGSCGLLGFPGSPYGSLAARLVRDSLHSYWHGGESAAQAQHPAATAATPPTPPAVGVFARRAAATTAAAAPVPEVTWLEARVHALARLEKERTRRNSPFPMTAAHQRYLDSSAFWRLRSAYALDRSDTSLYEILHFQLAARALQRPELKPEVVRLAEQAIAMADMPMAGFAAPLTGAGAAINLLNDLLDPKQVRRDDAAILKRWAQLGSCLRRYEEILGQAQAEDWWQGIPEVRREEVESHAAFLGRIAAIIRQQLVVLQLLPASEAP